MVNLKRSLGRGAAILAVALSSGHLVQTLSGEKSATLDAPQVRPASVVTVSSGPIDETPRPELPQIVRLPEPVFPVAPPALASAPEPSLPAPAPTAGQQANTCDPSLALAELPGAMIGVTLLSNCTPDARVVLRHTGLAVTARTTATGSYFATLPALLPDAEVTVLFEDGSRVSAEIGISSAAELRRFAVQWQADDLLALNAFEGGAVFYGSEGHVYAAAPGQPSDGAVDGGFLTSLGDAGVAMPLLAEVYTFPAGEDAEIVIEAAVTDATCGRELLGEMLKSDGKVVETEELTLSMPDCSAVGDYLVLKNPGSDTKIAAVR